MLGDLHLGDPSHHRHGVPAPGICRNLPRSWEPQAIDLSRHCAAARGDAGPSGSSHSRYVKRAVRPESRLRRGGNSSGTPEMASL